MHKDPWDEFGEEMIRRTVRWLLKLSVAALGGTIVWLFLRELLRP
jgi:hypothetical protein